MPILSAISIRFISAAENRLGVRLDYVRRIARLNTPLLLRYNRIFRILDPRKHLPADAYHTARLRAAMAADCGTCVEAEINLALQSGLTKEFLRSVMKGQSNSAAISAIIALTDAVIRDCTDDGTARQTICDVYGEMALTELALVITQASALPSIKRTMGFATTCNMDSFRALNE